MMKRKVWATAVMVMVVVVYVSCNNGMSSVSGDSGGRKAVDRSRRTIIDSAQYVDFTVKANNARLVRREDVIYALNNTTYRNGNSYIVINAKEGTIEISTDNGTFGGKENRQIYGVFGLDIQAASDDCLYIRKDQRKEGFLMVDGIAYRNDAIPDLAVCLPLYGYSRNRIEVSSIMNGYIAMPSGTYWK